jgi:hypothetical protein
MSSRPLLVFDLAADPGTQGSEACRPSFHPAHRWLRRLHGQGPATFCLSPAAAVLLVAHLLDGAPAQGSSGAGVVKSLPAGAQMTEAPASGVAEQRPGKGAGATALKQLLPPPPAADAYADHAPVTTLAGAAAEATPPSSPRDAASKRERSMLRRSRLVSLWPTAALSLTPP